MFLFLKIELALVELKNEFEPKIEDETRKIAELKKEKTDLQDFMETKDQV